MSADERRRFFRIEDEVAISFTVLEEGYGGETIDHTGGDLNQEFHMSIEVQLRQAIAEVKRKSPKLGNVLDLLNQKINLLRTLDQVSANEPVIKKANLSACGVAFCWPEALPINQQLLLDMYLQPNHEHVKTEAHVAAVEANTDPKTMEQDPYLVRLDFQNINSTYQELLIQHVVQRQSYQLRKKQADADKGD